MAIRQREKELVEGIIAGNGTIIAEFYQKYFPATKKYILNNSGNETDAEDVFQDALVFVYQKLKKNELELRCTLSTYVFAVGKNIWRNRHKKQRKISHQETTDLEMVSISLEKDIIDTIAQKEQEQLFRKYFLRLEKACQETLQLFFKGHSAREIAKKMGYEENYVRKKKFRCKKSLLEAIEKDPLYQELKNS